MIVDGVGWDGIGLGDQGNGAVSVCTLGVSDGKPAETVSSKIESLLAKKQGSQSERNWVQWGWNQWCLSPAISISINL